MILLWPASDALTQKCVYSFYIVELVLSNEECIYCIFSDLESQQQKAEQSIFTLLKRTFWIGCFEKEKKKKNSDEQLF